MAEKTTRWTIKDSSGRIMGTGFGTMIADALRNPGFTPNPEMNYSIRMGDRSMSSFGDEFERSANACRLPADDRSPECIPADPNAVLGRLGATHVNESPAVDAKWTDEAMGAFPPHIYEGDRVLHPDFAKTVNPDGLTIDEFQEKCRTDIKYFVEQTLGTPLDWSKKRMLEQAAGHTHRKGTVVDLETVIEINGDLDSLMLDHKRTRDDIAKSLGIPLSAIGEIVHDQVDIDISSLPPKDHDDANRKLSGILNKRVARGIQVPEEGAMFAGIDWAGVEKRALAARFPVLVGQVLGNYCVVAAAIHEPYGGFVVTLTCDHAETIKAFEQACIKASEIVLTYSSKSVDSWAPEPQPVGMEPIESLSFLPTEVSVNFNHGIAAEIIRRIRVNH